MAIEIPETLEACIDALVELDVERWGEAERDASRWMHRTNHLTYGLALNALSRRPEYDFGARAPEIVAAAERALSDDDREVLRNGA